jgi:hypothetical protein
MPRTKTTKSKVAERFANLSGKTVVVRLHPEPEKPPEEVVGTYIATHPAGRSYVYELNVEGRQEFYNTDYVIKIGEAAVQGDSNLDRPIQERDSPSRNATTFRLFAECPGDIGGLLEVVARDTAVSLHSQTAGLGGIEACIEVAGSMTVEDMRGYCREVPDGHYMLETVALPEDYTGERDMALN